MLAYRRGSRALVAVNTTDGPVSVPGRRGRVLISSDPRRGAGADGELALGAYEAAVVRTGRGD